VLSTAHPEPPGAVLAPAPGREGRVSARACRNRATPARRRPWQTQQFCHLIGRKGIGEFQAEQELARLRAVLFPTLFAGGLESGEFKAVAAMATDVHVIRMQRARHAAQTAVEHIEAFRRLAGFRPLSASIWTVPLAC